MEAEVIKQCGNFLQLGLTINYSSLPAFYEGRSPVYLLCGVTKFQVKAIVAQISNGSMIEYKNLIFIRFTKHIQDDELTYTIKFSCPEFFIKDKAFLCDDGTWHLINEGHRNRFVVTAIMDIVAHVSSFSSLHENTELTDFQLRGDDGSVNIHRAVLAASSPVLRRMLGSTWKKNTEGHVDFPGTSRVTLQHLRDYMYFHKLPEIGLKQLLLLARYFIMPDLEQKCVVKLMMSLRAQNAYDLLEFATNHKVTTLVFLILECVQSEVVNVSEMRAHPLHKE